LERITVMTNVGFWFLFGAAFVSAAVIGWVCFLELTCQLERRRSRKRAAPTSLSGLQTAGAGREILLQPRKPADGFREQLRTRKLKLRLPMHLRQWSP
jgi:hypothetical protein